VVERLFSGRLPLGDDLPGFLSPGRVAPPAVGILLLVFVLQSRFKGTTVEVEGNDVSGGEGILGQIAPEKFRDDARTPESDLPFLFLGGRGGVGRDNDPNQRSALGKALDWTIVERTTDSTLGAA